MFWTILLILVATTLALPVVFILYIRHIQGRPYWQTRGVPVLKPPQTGTLSERLKAPFHEPDFQLYRQMKLDKISVSGIMELGSPALFITDPDLIKAILVKDFDHFVNRPNLNVGSGDPYFHKILFNAEGSEWKDLRVTMTPTFTSAKIRRMFSIFQDSASQMVKYWNETLDSNCGVVNAQDATGKFTLNVIAAAAFGYESRVFSDPNSLFTIMSRRITDALAVSRLTMVKFMLLVFLPSIFNFFRMSVLDPIAIDFFVSLTRTAISEREKNEAARRDDFLQLMIDAKNDCLTNENEEGEGQRSTKDQKSDEGQRSTKLTDDLILAQCILFFNAGFDTVQALLDFCLYELALNPDVQQKLFEELDAAAGPKLGSIKSLNYEIISSLPYLDMVVSETLRKYPPAFRLTRKCTLDYTLPKTDLNIVKGTGIVIPVMPIHYDPDIYAEPNRFIPERFSAEEKANRHPSHYLPFGIGQRACIANRFALVEGKVAIAAAVLNFRFEPTARTTIPMQFLRSLSGLKPQDGIWLKVTKRN